jgi:hypothetical protein
LQSPGAHLYIHKIRYMNRCTERASRITITSSGMICWSVVLSPDQKRR